MFWSAPPAHGATPVGDGSAARPGTKTCGLSLRAAARHAPPPSFSRRPWRPWQKSGAEPLSDSAVPRRAARAGREGRLFFAPRQTCAEVRFHGFLVFERKSTCPFLQRNQFQWGKICMGTQSWKYVGFACVGALERPPAARFQPARQGTLHWYSFFATGEKEKNIEAQKGNFFPKARSHGI